MIQLRPAVKALIIACIGVFLCQVVFDQMLDGGVTAIFGLVPASVLKKGFFWQLLSYAFLHADVLHLTLNCLVLAFIGSDLEVTWGKNKFLQFYALCVLSAAVVYVFAQTIVGGVFTPMVGASGGIYGLLMAYGLLYPNRTMLFMMVFPMQAKHFVWILAGFEFLTTVSSRQGWLSSLAHLSGMGAGFLLLWVSRVRIPTRPASRKKSSHLRLVKDPAKSKDKSDSKKPPTFH
jgi:membrane associated rhomboid family serine protease